MKPYFDSDIVEICTNLGDIATELAGKTVLLTGARGFLGRYFTEVFAHLNAHVLDKPCTVFGFDNMITGGDLGSVLPTYPNMTYEKRDIVAPIDWDGPVDYVIHAAGIASPFYYRAFPLETVDVAVTGTRNLLKIATEQQARFTFFSTSEIYGDPEPRQVPTQESYRGNVSCRGPRACYDESKRLGETLCHIFHEKYGTATTTIRPFNVFGPGMQESDYRVLSNFASRIKAGQPLQVYGAGTQTRTFCYITDAMVGFLSTILKGVPGEAYNIGNPQPELSMLELVRVIERILGRPIDHRLIAYPDTYPGDEPMRRCPDIGKAQLHFNYRPTVPLEEGLRRFLSWTDRAYQGAG